MHPSELHARISTHAEPVGPRARDALPGSHSSERVIAFIDGQMLFVCRRSGVHVQGVLSDIGDLPSLTWEHVRCPRVSASRLFLRKRYKALVSFSAARRRTG